MSDLTSLFDALYTRLLLRDFFGKIVPGSFIILAIVISLPPYSDLYFRDGKMLRVHVILALAIFLGVAWIIAFAVQAFGETFKLIKWHGEKTDQEFLKKRVDFGRRASCRESQQLERLIVIKEACGNGYLALVLSALLLFLDFLATSGVHTHACAAGQVHDGTGPGGAIETLGGTGGMQHDRVDHHRSLATCI